MHRPLHVAVCVRLSSEFFFIRVLFSNRIYTHIAYMSGQLSARNTSTLTHTHTSHMHTMHERETNFIVRRFIFCGRSTFVLTAVGI